MELVGDNRIGPASDMTRDAFARDEVICIERKGHDGATYDPVYCPTCGMHGGHSISAEGGEGT